MMSTISTSEPPCDETPANTGENRGFGSVATINTAKNAYADLLSRGLRLSITADGGLSVRPGRLIDGAAADLIRENRSGLIAILARDEADPIRRGLLTGELTGWHIDADGNEVEGPADWHADALGVTR